MSRNLPTSLLKEILRASSDAVIIPFLTFYSYETADKIYIVGDGAKYILDGNTFEAMPFDFALLSDTDQTPEVKLTVPNVDRVIGEKIKNLVDPVSLKLELFEAEDFDLTVDPRVAIGAPVSIYTAQDMLLREVQVDVLQVSGTVKGWDIRGEYSTKIRATQDRLPALYR